MARRFELPVEIRGIDKITGPLSKIGSKLKSFGAGTRKVGRQFSLGVTAPVVAFGALTLSSAADFEKGMNRVRALTGGTGPVIEKLTRQARDLGETTVFSASEAAGAMGFLAQAGFDTEEIYGAIPGTLTLAAAATSDLAETADIASNILSGYNLEVSETNRLANVLTGTFTNSNTSLEQLGEAFKIAGPVAAAMNIPLENTAAVLGVLGNAGFQASLGGTALRGALAKLGNPTAEAAKAMAGLKLDVGSFRDTEGNITDLTQLVRELEDKGAGAVDLLQIFGQRAGPAMAALVGQGADEIARLQNELTNTDAAAIAAIQMQGAAGATKALASAFEGLQLAIADSGLLKDFTDIVRGLTDWIRGLSDTNPRMLKMVTILAAIAATIGPVLIGIGLMASGLGTVATGFSLVLGKGGALFGFIKATAIPFVIKMGAAFFALPFGWIVASIAGVVAAGFLLVKNWSKVKAWFGGVWDFFGEKVSAFVSWTMEKLAALTDWLPGWVKEKLGFDGDIEVDVGGQRIAEANAVGAGVGAGRNPRSRLEVEFANLPAGARVASYPDPDVDLDVTSGFALGGV